MKIKPIVQLLRPEQWAKNTFVFLPIFFSGQLLKLDLFLQCIVSFLAFSAAASSVYCFNDIYDVEVDRRHPKKCKRPIASKKVSIRTAYFIMLFFLSLSFLILMFLSNDQRYIIMTMIGAYCIMNVSYTLKLKHYPIIDVIIISFGFVLRVLVGGATIEILLSEWIIMMTFLIALFLAFAKRRDDVLLFEATGVKPRRNTHRYNIAFLNQAVTVTSSIVIVSYIMYTTSPSVFEQFQSKYVYVTAFFVLSGIIRYLQVTIVDLKGGNPTKVLLNDRFIQGCIVGWIVAFLIIIYT